jgi:hypothetical protein
MLINGSIKTSNLITLINFVHQNTLGDIKGLRPLF